jgi:hypothetical protein
MIRIMKYLKFLTFSLVISSLFIGGRVWAAAFPLPGISVLLKSVTSGQVTAIDTDKDGNFNTTVKEGNGIYNLFVGDESMPPIKILAKNGNVSGRIVVLTEGTIAQDPTPTPIPTPAVKKTTAVIKTVKTLKTNTTSR